MVDFRVNSRFGNRFRRLQMKRSTTTTNTSSTFKKILRLLTIWISVVGARNSVPLGAYTNFRPVRTFGTDEVLAHPP